MGTSHAYGAADHASFRAELLVLFQAFSHGLVFDWGSAPSQPQPLSVAQQKQTFVPSAEGVLTLRRMRLVVAAAHMYLSWTPDGSRTPFCATLAKRLQRSLDDAAAQAAGGREEGDDEFEVYFENLRRAPSLSLGAMHALCRADFVQQAQRASKSSEPSPPSSGKSSFKTSPIASPSPSTSDLAAAADAESLYGPTGAPAGITTFGVPTAPSAPLTGAPLAARLLPLASPRETSFTTEDDDESVRRTSVVSEIGPLRGETELGDDILPVPSADLAASLSGLALRASMAASRGDIAALDRATPAE